MELEGRQSASMAVFVDEEDCLGFKVGIWGLRRGALRPWSRVPGRCNRPRPAGTAASARGPAAAAALPSSPLPDLALNPPHRPRRPPPPPGVGGGAGADGG